jgi:hypothetical protein
MRVTKDAKGAMNFDFFFSKLRFAKLAEIVVHPE